jgi:hypothetical protein
MPHAMARSLPAISQTKTSLTVQRRRPEGLTEICFRSGDVSGSAISCERYARCHGLWVHQANATFSKFGGLRTRHTG